MNNDRIKSVPVNDATAKLLSRESNFGDWHIADRYRILQLVGEGGMGKVFKVFDLEENAVCAVKVMHNHLNADSVNRLRFEREARLAATLSHPNIVKTTNYGVTSENEPFIEMEYLVGESLDEVLSREKRLTFAEFAPVFGQVCSAMQYAHNSGVVHRDMKPSNVMLLAKSFENYHKQVKIVDFGIAKVCRTTGDVCPKSGKSLGLGITQPGEIFGSPLYMSPEQCMGDEVDCRSEVYSLGCMLFETLTGEAPLKGRSFRETIMQRVHKQAPKLSDVLPAGNFSVELENIVAHCLQREPDDRFQSVEELKLAVLSIATGEEKPAKHRPR